MHKEDPYVVFLSETKVHESKVDKIKRCCGMDACIGVNANGRSGGLAMMWKEEAKLRLLSLFVNHIDMMVEAELEKIWQITGFYREPNSNKKGESWSLLRLLATQSNVS